MGAVNLRSVLVLLLVSQSFGYASLHPYGLQSPKQEKINIAIAKLIAKGLQPYSLVADDGFKNLVKTLDPQANIRSKTYMQELLFLSCTHKHVMRSERSFDLFVK